MKSKKLQLLLLINVIVIIIIIGLVSLLNKTLMEITIKYIANISSYIYIEDTHLLF